MGSIKKMIETATRIEFVFDWPNDQFGPGAVLMHRPKSGFTVIFFGWEVAGTSVKGYSRSYTEGNMSSVSATSRTELKLKADIGADKLAEFKAKGTRVSSVKVDLMNGKSLVSMLSISDFLDKLKDPNSRFYKELRPFYDSYKHEAKFYFLKNVYAFDFEYFLEIDDKFEATSSLSRELLNYVDAKLGLSLSSTKDIAFNGKGLYVGFNGLPVNYRPDKNNPNSVRGAVRLEQRNRRSHSKVSLNWQTTDVSHRTIHDRSEIDLTDELATIFTEPQMLMGAADIDE